MHVNTVSPTPKDGACVYSLSFIIWGTLQFVIYSITLMLKSENIKACDCKNRSTPLNTRTAASCSLFKNQTFRYMNWAQNLQTLVNFKSNNPRLNLFQTSREPAQNISSLLVHVCKKIWAGLAKYKLSYQLCMTTSLDMCSKWPLSKCPSDLEYNEQRLNNKFTLLYPWL